MPDFPDLIFLLAAGALGGFLSGLLGVGGGIIFIPILDVILSRYGIRTEMVKFILANSLAVIIFTGIFNSYRQYKAGNFFPSFILYTALPGMVTVLIASWLISKGEWYNKQLFNLVFACLLIPGTIRMFFTKKEVKNLKETISREKFIAVGSVTGIFTAFSGLGGGLVMVPAFVNLLRLEMKKATSVSAGVVPFFALPAVVYYMLRSPVSDELHLHHLGFLVYPVIVPMIAGTLLTVPLGVKLGHKMPARTVQLIFAVFVLTVLCKILYETTGA
jgi:uncharacterized membrane protein YfcA